MNSSIALRRKMVERQLVPRGIADEQVLDAMGRVAREAFVPPGMEEFAYNDTPLPITHGQTISQPYIVALMAQAAELRPGHRVLEIGTGSGYAAAVVAEIVGRVDTIERQPGLAAHASENLRRQGYMDVAVHTGDGTLGWPQGAPFDVILAAASGPDVPRAWREQLAVGGRLIMPVGTIEHTQRLLKITRINSYEYAEEDLGAVAFVPLVGQQGWPDDDMQAQLAAVQAEPKPAPRPKRRQAPIPAATNGLAEQIWEAAEPLPDIDDPLFATLFDRYAEKRVVLLGEASHGTAEFYRARAAITRRLIEAHGFDMVAVEADWPDAASVDNHVRQRHAAKPAEPPFRRFPAWMWRNRQVEAFVEWLHAHNDMQLPERRGSFHGLDLYSMTASVAAVLNYLDTVDPAAARTARERYGCLTPWQKDPAVYGRAVAGQGYRQCEQAVVAQLRDLLDKRLEYARGNGEQFLDAAQNARLVAAAERYYRAMYEGSAQSWNLRDTHMFETLGHLLQARGPHSRAVVWAHNSHVGNAAATEMGRVREELNLGQLCREHYGDAAALVGFGTHTGTVAAASGWDAPMQIMQVRPSREDSVENLMHLTGQPRFLLDLRPGVHDTLRTLLRADRLERYIGVIYRPDTELHSHYAEASLADQYDAYVWFDETTAITPLPTTRRKGMPETYPFGV